jgi:hypothetical protein
MDVTWQEGVGSFLDSSGIDPSSSASFESGDGSVLWPSSGDSRLFSSQSVLWESGPDSPGDSRIGALTLDSAGGTDAGTLTLGGWSADATPEVANGLLNGDLVWAGAGSETSRSLINNGGVGLGALDLSAAGGTSSEWQQFVAEVAGGSATGLAEVPHLLWTGASSQLPSTVPVPDGSQPLHMPPSDNLSLPTLGNVSPAQVVWTQPSGAPQLTAGTSPGEVPIALTQTEAGLGEVQSAQLGSTSGLPISAHAQH